MPSSYELYRQARERMDAGCLEEAVSLFARSVAIDPHFKALEQQGECLLRLGRTREAIVPLAAATTLNRGSRAPALLADAFLRLGEMDDAREMAALALSRGPATKLSRRVAAQVEGRTAERDGPEGDADLPQSVEEP